jgi:hypothetical protein
MRKKLKCTLKTKGGRERIGFIWLKIGTSREHGNGPSGSVQVDKSLDKLTDY